METKETMTYYEAMEWASPHQCVVSSLDLLEYGKIKEKSFSADGTVHSAGKRVGRWWVGASKERPGTRILPSKVRDVNYLNALYLRAKGHQEWLTVRYNKMCKDLVRDNGKQPLKLYVPMGPEDNELPYFVTLELRLDTKGKPRLVTGTDCAPSDLPELNRLAWVEEWNLRREKFKDGRALYRLHTRIIEQWRALFIIQVMLVRALTRYLPTNENWTDEPVEQANIAILKVDQTVYYMSRNADSLGGYDQSSLGWNILAMDMGTKTDVIKLDLSCNRMDP